MTSKEVMKEAISILENDYHIDLSNYEKVKQTDVELYNYDISLKRIFICEWASKTSECKFSITIEYMLDEILSYRVLHLKGTNRKNPICTCGSKTKKNWFQSSVHRLIIFTCKSCKKPIYVERKRVPF